MGRDDFNTAFGGNTALDAGRLLGIPRYKSFNNAVKGIKPLPIGDPSFIGSLKSHLLWAVFNPLEMIGRVQAAEGSQWP